MAILSFSSLLGVKNFIFQRIILKDWRVQEFAGKSYSE